MRSLSFFCFLVPFILIGQTNPTTSTGDRLESVTQFDQEHSNIQGLQFENIGPTIFSGRVTDVAVDPEDPTHFYVAYASGGLWETVNNGTTFSPIFDNEAVMTIGAISVDWTSGEIWVGTGEVNSSRSSYAGTGIYKSKDGGTSWEHLGLPESHHIGRIILHPENPKIAWVAVLGHLYSTNPERGVYQTSDGGATWQHSLAIDDNTGVVDLVIDPQNPDVLYAAAWERSRSAWNFEEAGPGSGIYKTVNGGSNWAKISGGSSGFPDGEGTGRIGLSIGEENGRAFLYALLDNYNRRPPEDEQEEEGLTKDDFRSMSVDEFLNLEAEDIETYLRDSRFPNKYTGKSVYKMVEEGKVLPEDLATYLENANALLFDTPVIGAELYVSRDQGVTWTKTHADYLDGVYFSYGYYFGVVKAHPTKAEQVYIAGVPILRSDDGGKTFSNINGDNVHVDHHSIWINPENPDHVINGNDGGINISYDAGENWIKCNSPSVGQFYYINVDQAKPYNVYGGTQDNGVWRGSHQYREGVRWHSTGQYPYKSILGGDGMQVQIDPRDNNTIYTGLQFGNYYRINGETGDRSFITPRHELGQRPYRWNWQTPIHLSEHQPDILYMGGHVLFRSFNQGEEFEAISEDLTRGGKKGDVPYGTLTTIHESPLKFGLIYTGSDDGLIYRSKDGGHSWHQITNEIPEELWVSRIQASNHQEGRVYVSLNGYRTDDFNSYIYKSEDYGDSWTAIGSNLPLEPVNVIKEDPEHEDILYVGTDRGVYISFNQGVSFERTFDHIPNVPVHDIIVQQAEKDLLIGTHGRSIYKADLEDIYPIVANKDSPLIIAEISTIRHNDNWGSRRNQFRDFTIHEEEIPIFSTTAGRATITISEEEGLPVWEDEISLVKGLNYWTYTLQIQESTLDQFQENLEESEKLEKAKDGNYYLPPGKYTVTVKRENDEATTEIEIKERK
ncbi:MAG: glycosyl hydrolase [Saprospiraceae bacterium]|nr:glycosyl hydrolase [Saprospiraceae bacterium]